MTQSKLAPEHFIAMLHERAIEGSIVMNAQEGGDPFTQVEIDALNIGVAAGITQVLIAMRYGEFEGLLTP